MQAVSVRLIVGPGQPRYKTVQELVMGVGSLADAMRPWPTPIVLGPVNIETDVRAIELVIDGEKKFHVRVGDPERWKRVEELFGCIAAEFDFGY